MKKMMILGLLLLGCEVSPEDASRILESEGLHNITYNGPTMGCGQDDGMSQGFVAYRTVLNPDGTPHEVRVEGVVCCGVFKACTVRY